MSSVGNAWQLIREAAAEWSADNAARLGAAVAFYSILSLAPLLVLAVSIAGFIFGEEAARGELLGQIRGLVGSEGADVVETALANARKPEAGVLASVIGAITLLFGASGVFGELHGAMNAVWNVRATPRRGIWGLVRDKVLSFGMVLSVGFLLLVSLVVSAGLSAVADYANRIAPGVPVLMQAVNQFFSLAIVVGLFGVLFRYLPDVRTPWRNIWFGAAVTGVLFTVGKYVIGVYLAKAAVGSPFGAAGSVVALVVWIYYSALIVFFGAEVTQVHARRAGAKVEPAAGSEFVDSKEARQTPSRSADAASNADVPQRR